MPKIFAFAISPPETFNIFIEGELRKPKMRGRMCSAVVKLRGTHDDKANWALLTRQQLI
jgi:hypothetical protein